jgi:hypothetical protein
VENILYRGPNLGYQSVGVRGNGFDGKNNYNSLQVTVRKQLSHGLTLQAAYTWSKDLTDLSNIGAKPTANSNDASCNYDLPFGTNSGFVGKVTEGMECVGCDDTSGRP